MCVVKAVTTASIIRRKEEAGAQTARVKADEKAAKKRLEAEKTAWKERQAAEKMQPVYEKRRPVVKAIQKFWPVALMNHEMFAIHCQHNADQVALAYLEDQLAATVIGKPAEDKLEARSLELQKQEDRDYEHRVNELAAVGFRTSRGRG